MKTNILLTLGVATLSVAFSGCSATVSTGNTTNASNTNAAKPANTTATNSNATNTNAAAPADSSVVKLEEGGLQMTLPNGFEMTKEAGDVVVSTADDGVAVRFTVPADGDYEKAVKDAADNLDKYITDVKVESEAKADKINGMDAMSSSGTGKDKAGKKVNWDLTVLKTDKKPVLAIIYAEEESMNKHADDLKAFFDSVKKM